MYAEYGSIQDARQAFSKWGKMSDARQLFDEMPERNSVAWNAMIAGYAQHGQSEQALELFFQMLKDTVSRSGGLNKEVIGLGNAHS